jgi:WD40-like Beta Propeller Repeat
MKLKWMLACAVAVLLALPADSFATYPGGNGKIVFNRADQLWTMNADGSNQQAFGAAGYGAQWSADGTKLAWPCSGGICTANADGSAPNAFTARNPGSPTWSPDGNFLVYSEAPFCSHGICGPGPNLWRIRSADGSDEVFYRGGSDPDWSADGTWVAYVEDVNGWPQVKLVGGNNVPGPQLTSGAAVNVQPNFSPDNTIAFTSYRDGNAEIYTMKADGSAQTNLTNNPASDGDPEWSPDGQKIVFTSNRDGNPEIYSMNADGSAVTRLTNDPLGDSGPDWQPIRAYLIRPKGATPVRASLVPAYNRCTAPNNQHGAPLSFGSCSPPDLTAIVASMGPKSIGYALLKVLAGSGTADVGIMVSLTDVHLRADGSDMEGSLDFGIPVRITDYDNTGSRVGPGTVVDLNYANSPFHVKLPCTMTPSDPTIGSTCSVQTSVNALTPPQPNGPFISPGKRALWQLDRLAVYDGGRDGVPDTYGDNTPVAVQGVFVP